MPTGFYAASKPFDQSVRRTKSRLPLRLTLSQGVHVLENLVPRALARAVVVQVLG